MSIPVSQFIPPPSLPGNHKIVFYICDSLCLVNKFICTISQDSTYKWYHVIFILLCLTSFIMTISMSVHVASNGIILSFFMAEYIPL